MQLTVHAKSNTVRAMSGVLKSDPVLAAAYEKTMAEREAAAEAERQRRAAAQVQLRLLSLIVFCLVCLRANYVHQHRVQF